MPVAGERFALAACVAHFLLPDQPQVELLRSALARAGRVVVFITRAYQAPTARHPFGWRDRMDILSASLDEDQRSRVAFEPLREHWDERRTLRAVQAGVQRHRDADTGAVLCLWAGTIPEDEDWPAGWTVEPCGESDEPSERRLDSLYAAGDPLSAWRGIEGDLAQSTRDKVSGWLGTPEFGRLREEWRLIAREKKAWAAVPYPVTLVTVDAVVRAGDHVLLIERGRAPGKGLWALPGGFLETGDTVLRSALRELAEETGLPFSPREMRERLRGVKVFDHPRRSQRGRIVTHSHFFDLGDIDPPPVQGGDDAAAAKWVPIAELPALETRMHDDHFHMIDEFLGLTGDP
ncbi:NUDIX domain-containing protein [Ramlibacter henchirensis]|uniref:NUDIX domain-containing protein n=1 Tax=Ramlibacter henchirensis TaxID=204072 RepID=A0A4Z0C761_9BURK|nr:NUDIX domain-containing protein [Ramlibacter henchirensis]TFZ06218.1 NUDIX domain-containing protein [Ramlibacter henchirensis]